MDNFSIFSVSLAKFFRILSLLCVLSIATTAQSATRHALVIGNSAYGSGFDLINPSLDSTSIAAQLDSLGYQVHGGGAQTDLTLEEFDNTLNSFLASVEDGSSTLIYYAGHGAASGGSNYLIPILPVGVRLRTEADMRQRSILLQSILEQVENSNPSGVNVFFFDACRDAPIELTRSLNLTGLTSLATASQPRGSFVGFSTEYGKLALDGDANQNSPFAQAILDALKTHSSIPIELFFKSIRQHVYKSTDGQQFPIQESKIRGSHCIIECKTGLQISPSEFGEISVSTSPLDANVCFLLEGWKVPLCGPQAQLPINKEVQITATAKGYIPYSAIHRISTSENTLSINLDKKPNNTLKILGGVAAAAVLTGIVLSSGSDKSEGTTDRPFSVTVTRPTQ